MHPQPLDRANLARVEAVFTDVDGTLTTHDRLRSSTLHALERLADAAVPVVLVSGRPAGFGECWIRTLPIEAAILENGGLYFCRDDQGRVRKRYAQRAVARHLSRKRLLREVNRAMQLVRGARLSSDSAYTEVDVAIDYNEDVSLGHAVADVLEQFLIARGVRAVRSSVHVNCWIGNFDKLIAVKRFMRAEWAKTLRSRDDRFIYVGDSFNDAPMFQAFPLSIGVANVRRVLDRIDHPPSFITTEEGGAGFVEVVENLLRERRRKTR